ncbi:MAG TPA: VOC family protein [Desulfosalsimonadaceae bacterium]|nr:VOC family protein [Desulfosalsimonadaceae bacterium]
MIYFDELLKAPDFHQAVASLAADFRKAHGLPKVHQLGLLVEDVETAAKELEDRGIGPFFIAAGSPVFWMERGDKKTIQGRLGLAYYQGIEIELLEPLEGSEFYTRSLDPDGRIVVQQLGFLVDDVETWADKLTMAGTSLWLLGRLKLGPAKYDFAYMKPLDDSDLIIEFITWRLLGVRINPPVKLLKTLARLEKLTGKDTIRV